MDQKKLINNYTDLLLELINDKTNNGPRTYGFEYEFIATEPLDLSLMKRIYDFLPACGFTHIEDSYRHSTGVYITFEPGGQIVYHSPPLLPNDKKSLNSCIELIHRTNSRIHQELNIEYIARGYIPGRQNSPLCLEADRYKYLHARMAVSGTRGREMMKAQPLYISTLESEMSMKWDPCSQLCANYPCQKNLTWELTVAIYGIIPTRADADCHMEILIITAAREL